MSWFTAILVRGSFVEDALDEKRLGDRLFKLADAPDAEVAYRRALELGAAASEEYTEDDGTAVSLRFLGLADLKAVPDARIADGAEVYSELIETKPNERVLEKDRLTVFETDEELTESEDSGFERLGAAGEEPIRPG